MDAPFPAPPCGQHCVLLEDTERALLGARERASSLADRLRASEEETLALMAAHARLEAARQAVSDLVTTVSHDLRTPLTVIQGALELATVAEVPVAEREEMLLRARRHVEFLIELSQELVNLAGHDRSDPSCRPALVDLGAVAVTTCEGLEPVARRHGMTVRVSTPPHELPVFAARCDIERVVANLVANAIKYAPDGSEVDVELRAGATGRWRVHVADRGPGVPPEIQPRLFERWARGPRPAKAGPSTGLGLWIVRTTVSRLQGTVGVDERPGGGSVFWFELPVHAGTGTGSGNRTGNGSATGNCNASGNANGSGTGTGNASGSGNRTGNGNATGNGTASGSGSGTIAGTGNGHRPGATGPAPNGP